MEWNYEIDSTVIDTVGGRVVQVLGATLSDFTVVGHYGQNRAAGQGGESWKLAEAFGERIREIQAYQSRDATEHGLMHVPATFNYAPKGWRFLVYVKALADSQGGSVAHQTGRFSYDYALTLFMVDVISDDLHVLSGAKKNAIDAYLARISDGIGWHFSQYNGQVPPSPVGGLYGRKNFTDEQGAKQQVPTTRGGGGGTPLVGGN